MGKGCIIYCVEGGRLERNTLLSIASIKRYGGDLNRYDIFCVQPRPQFPISKKVEHTLRDLGCTLISKPLNTKHSYYGLVNKPLACDYITEHYDYDQYIFLDGDTIVLQEPKELLTRKKGIALSPVATKGAGIHGPRDSNSEYWERLVSKPNLLYEQESIETTVSKEEIVPYWNSGVIVFGSKSSISGKWSELVQKALDERWYPEQGLFFVEQTCLSAVLAEEKTKVNQLKMKSNYPMTIRELEEAKSIDLDQIDVLHHYNNLELLFAGSVTVAGDDKGNWIKEKAAHFGLIEQRGFSKMKRRLEAMQNQSKERMHYLIYRMSGRTLT